MEDREIDQLRKQKAFDDCAQAMRNIAELVGCYYIGLKKEKVPDDLLTTLVRDWHWLYFHKANWPNDVPQTVPSEWAY